MTLEVPECAVVGDDLEPVAQRLQSTAGPVAAIGPYSDEVREHPRSGRVVETGDGLEDRLLIGRGRFEQQRRQQILLVALGLQQRDRGPVEVPALAGVDAEA